MFPAFPKLFALGHRCITSIFDHYVEVTEKIDGSQFSFGQVKGELRMRSKGCEVYADGTDNLFRRAVEFAKDCYLHGVIPEGFVFYGETLYKPKHNVLAYDRVPTNNFALFGVINTITGLPVDNHQELTLWANRLGCEVVPLLFHGMVSKKDDLLALLETTSMLGGQKIEGVVVKRYIPYNIGFDVMPLMGGKFVSEAFKEVHQKQMYGGAAVRDAKQDLFEQYRTIPRWMKAVQHLRERNELTESPKDIGALLKEVNIDVLEECEHEVKDALWEIFRKDFLRNVTKGLPEWYKEQLLALAFPTTEDSGPNDGDTSAVAA